MSYWFYHSYILINRVDELLMKVEQIFADPETGVPSKTLGLLGKNDLSERLNKLEDQVGDSIQTFFSYRLHISDFGLRGNMNAMAKMVCIYMFF